jgi:hypothetical protein
MLACCLLALAAPVAAATAEQRWMRHVEVLAADDMEGRLTGTPGYDRAAAYVAGAYAKLGLKPAGTDGFLQPVALLEQSVDLKTSRLELVGKDRVPLVLGEQLLPGTRVPQLPGAFDAPLVFIGSGLHLPEQGHDDFAGLDLRGKVVVTLAGGPKRLSGALKSHARSAEFWPAMERAGAIGVIALQNPNQMDVPWERQKLFAATPGMRLSDPALNDAKRPYFTASFSPAEAGMLFAASGHDFDALVKAATAGEVLPRFPLNLRLKGAMVARDRAFSSPNVVALLPGRDRRLAAEHVVLTAHLDHVGVDQPVDGDRIYNGAMDNASGIASMIETARALKKAGTRRSVLLVAVTAEERGLLGSRYYASVPTVPRESLVANINMDMFLPLWPFTHVTALGAEESTLGAVSAEAARAVGATQVADDAPERNLFVRSDQYSFVRTGVPALALKFATSSPAQEKIQKDWLTNRYHAPSDDLNQPIEPAFATAFNRYLERLILAVANGAERPSWYPESFFRRFAQAPATQAP